MHELHTYFYYTFLVVKNLFNRICQSVNTMDLQQQKKWLVRPCLILLEYESSSAVIWYPKLSDKANTTTEFKKQFQIRKISPVLANSKYNWKMADRGGIDIKMPDRRGQKFIFSGYGSDMDRLPIQFWIIGSDRIYIHFWAIGSDRKSIQKNWIGPHY